MKSLFSLLLVLSLSGHAYSDCIGGYLNIFPKGQELKQNSWIVIEGDLDSKQILLGLNMIYPIYLESEGHRVNLLLKSAYNGMFGLTQAFLKPEKALHLGKTYELKIDHLSKEEREAFHRFDWETGKQISYTWKIVKGTDQAAPLFEKQPSSSGKFLEFYGCGPAVFAYFEMQTTDDSQVWVKTELVEISSKESNTYCVQPDAQGRVEIGHDMCLGAFKFKLDKTYKVRFQLMDICGNSNEEWTAWIEFESPLERDSFE